MDQRVMIASELNGKE